MKIRGQKPRIILISQWPNVKNAEYELIEKIRQTDFKITVVDYLGFDVDTNVCINHSNLVDEYDFAISFHYETPKFLNLPTFLWIANPLEYMHLRTDYRTAIIHNCRAYDEFLYNQSDVLVEHVKRFLGAEWVAPRLYFHIAQTASQVFPPLVGDALDSIQPKIFYCGVNWERIMDQGARSQGLLELLQSYDVADFFGPQFLEGREPWAGFSSYQGEIPFDGVSIGNIMRNYTAVLALSSPAHLKSHTSSSRVFEGVAAGVPVISDENPHVKKLFADSVYYFSGSTETERVTSILRCLDEIKRYPEVAKERVLAAQEKMRLYYSFDVTLPHITQFVRQTLAEKHDASMLTMGDGVVFPSTATEILYDIFLFHHDPYALEPTEHEGFLNLQHVIKAASMCAVRFDGVVRICFYDPFNMIDQTHLPQIDHVMFVNISDAIYTENAWQDLRLGEKVYHLQSQAKAAFVSFLTQADFPQYDYCIKALESIKRCKTPNNTLYIHGFFVSDLSLSVRESTSGILRNSQSVGMYRWTQDSIAEHQLGIFCFSLPVLRRYDFHKMKRLDVLLPLTLALEALTMQVDMVRGRFYTLRSFYGVFHRYHKVYEAATQKSFWAQHYEITSNHLHELNALYDLFHATQCVVEILDKISGHSLPPPCPVHTPAVLSSPVVEIDNSEVIEDIHPISRVYRKAKHMIMLGRKHS